MDTKKYTTIRISRDVHKRLKALKKENEDIGDVVERLLGPLPPTKNLGGKEHG